MKSIIILAALVAVVIASAPPPLVASDPSKPIEILESVFNQEPNSAYVSHFKTANGIEFSEEGTLKDVVGEDNKPQAVVIVKGSYSYTDKEGKPVFVEYFADETGFHATGDTIPKAP